MWAAAAASLSSVSGKVSWVDSPRVAPRLARLLLLLDCPSPLDDCLFPSLGRGVAADVTANTACRHWLTARPLARGTAVPDGGGGEAASPRMRTAGVALLHFASSSTHNVYLLFSSST